MVSSKVRSRIHESSMATCPAQGLSGTVSAVLTPFPRWSRILRHGRALSLVGGRPSVTERHRASPGRGRTGIATETTLYSDVRYVKGVGPKMAELFAKGGVETIEDLLYYVPRTYADWSRIANVDTLKVGDHVTWHMTNIETAFDATHGFALPGQNINLSLEPGEAATIEFDVSDEGSFTFYCTEFCSALHLEMAGFFMVAP